jgi:HK97 family phage prohead protease
MKGSHMNKNVKEQRTFSLKIKALSESGEFTGYASTFGNIDLGGDIVDPGAFKKTLNESKGKIPILDHHDPERHIGWNLSAVEDEHGLLVTGKLDLNVQIARERHSLMKMAQEVGGETGLSIGYQTIKSEPDKSNPLIRHLKEIRLLEYSVVVFPMNPSASIETVKQEPIHSGEPDHSKQLEPLMHSLNKLITIIKTINQEYSQWK